MNNRMYLVTGAAGFLGGTVCRQLVERGENVRAFVLPNDKAIKYVPKEAEIIEGDLTDMDSLERFFDVPEDKEFIVLQIASIVTVNPEFNQKVFDVNVGGTNNILALCKEHPNCKKLVYCSSTGCIPELPKGQAIREIGHYASDGLRDCYSQTKAMATQAVLDAASEGLNACIVFPSGILGPEDFAVGHTTKVLAQIINGEMPVAISGSFNLCDVRDLADGLIKAADKGRKGECYILGNEAISFKEFAKTIAEESGCKPMRFFLPGWVAYKLAEVLEKKAARKGGKPQMTTYAVWNLMRNNVFDSSKAQRELGYRTRPYRETIHDEIVWMKDAGLISDTVIVDGKLAEVGYKVIAEGVTDGFTKIEKDIVKGYEAIENGAVTGFNIVSDWFISKLFQHKSETLVECKARLQANAQNATK